MKSLQELCSQALLDRPDGTVDWTQLPGSIVDSLFPVLAEGANSQRALSLLGPQSTDVLVEGQTKFADPVALRDALARCTALRRLVVSAQSVVVDDALCAVLPDSLESLTLAFADAITPAMLAALMARLHGLRTLSLRSYAKLPIVFTAFASPHLESLSLRGCSPTEAVLVPLLRSLVAVRDVDLSGCTTVTNAALLTLLASAPRLHALSIDGCVKVTDAFVSTLRDNTTLAYLSIAELPRVRHIEGLLPRSLVHLHTTSMVPPPTLASLPHLQSLIASFNRYITSDSFVSGAGAGALTTLGLSGCISLDDEAVERITMLCPLLHTLNVSRCPLLTNASVQSLSRCAHLQELALFDDTHITDVGPLAAGCRELRVLLVGGCVLLADVGCVLRACPQLTVLHAAGCALLTDALLVPLFAAVSPPRLARLDLSDCKHAGAPSARAICHACPALASLNMEVLRASPERKEALREVAAAYPRVRLRGGFE